MKRELMDFKKWIFYRYALITLLIVLPIFIFSQTNTLLLKLNKPYNYNGLSLTLLHKTEYNPMIGTSAFLKAKYKDREDILILSIPTCEPDLDLMYQWQGYIFKLPHSIKNKSNNSITLAISKEKITSVENVFNQENLQMAYDKLKQEMNIAENQPGSVSGIKIKSDSISFHLEYQHGKVRHVYDWQEFITEQIQVKGEILKQDYNNYGFTYKLLKSENGEVKIYSTPTSKNEEGLNSSLNFLLDK